MPEQLPDLICVGCQRPPSQIPEYNDVAFTDGDDPDTFVRENEGTLNVETGRFACTECYIALGMPSNPWPQPHWTP